MLTYLVRDHECNRQTHSQDYYGNIRPLCTVVHRAAKIDIYVPFSILVKSKNNGIYKDHLATPVWFSSVLSRQRDTWRRLKRLHMVLRVVRSKCKLRHLVKFDRSVKLEEMECKMKIRPNWHHQLEMEIAFLISTCLV